MEPNSSVIYGTEQQRCLWQWLHNLKTDPPAPPIHRKWISSMLFSSSWCSPFLPAPLCSPLDWPQLSSRLCVMQGEHQLGRRNSGLHRGRLLLHTTPSLCRLFLVSFFATPVFSVCICSCICVCICINICICNSGPCRGWTLVHRVSSLCLRLLISLLYHLCFMIWVLHVRLLS